MVDSSAGRLIASKVSRLVDGSAVEMVEKTVLHSAVGLADVTVAKWGYLLAAN
jgi:hypothetical protein